jgi:dTDP-4-dehydrorhamnose 3,5-epimerase
VKGWHYHKKQWDHFTCVKGTIKLVLYDSREESTTHDHVNEFIISRENPQVISIPPFVMHGFECVGTEEAVVINTPTQPYDKDNPDELRVDPFNNNIPFNWTAKKGG